MATGQPNSFGKRRRYAGKTVLRKKIGTKWSVAPRANEPSRGVAKISYECGQTKAYDTKSLPGRFKVQIPHGRLRYVRPAR